MFYFGVIVGVWLAAMCYILGLVICGAIEHRSKAKRERQKEQEDFRKAVLKELEELKKKDK